MKKYNEGSKKILKLTALICLMAMLTGLLAACGSKEEPEGEGDGGGEEKKVLIVGTEPTYAPFDTTDEEGNVTARSPDA